MIYMIYISAKSKRSISCGWLLGTLLNFGFIFAGASPDLREVAGNKGHKKPTFPERIDGKTD